MTEFERELIIERTKAGLASARARGRNGGRPYKMTAAKLRLAQAAMGQPGTKVGELCTELGITRQTLYRHANQRVAWTWNERTSPNPVWGQAVRT